MTHNNLLEPLSFDPEASYVLALEAKLEADEQASQAVYSDIEVDSSMDIFGMVYRVWQGMKLLGVFFRSPIDGKWVTEPFCCNDKKRYDTSNQAQAAIIRAWSHR